MYSRWQFHWKGEFFLVTKNLVVSLSILLDPYHPNTVPVDGTYYRICYSYLLNLYNYSTHETQPLTSVPSNFD